MCAQLLRQPSSRQQGYDSTSPFLLFVSHQFSRLIPSSVRQNRTRKMVKPTRLHYNQIANSRELRQLSFLSYRSQDWQIQNTSCIRDSQKWKMLVSVAADALICATGGFANADMLPPPHSTAALEKLPVFAQPFSAVKKMPSSCVPILYHNETDCSFLSKFMYNKACQCK